MDFFNVVKHILIWNLLILNSRFDSYNAELSPEMRLKMNYQLNRWSLLPIEYTNKFCDAMEWSH
jgi:hypothetical protein